MESNYMDGHFSIISQQREEMVQTMGNYKNKEWQRPNEEKWSFGETYYHLYLMIKRFRQLNLVYIPVAKPFATVRKSAPYATDSNNIYAEYQRKYNKPMRAPSILLPPKRIESKLTFQWLVAELDKETASLKGLLKKVSDDLAGHIRYPDPIANYPNLIQSIHLLAIHEKHHFDLCKKYYAINEKLQDE